MAEPMSWAYPFLSQRDLGKAPDDCKNLKRPFGELVWELEPMQIVVNGEPRDFKDSGTIADLVSALGLQPKFVAVERNETLVPRARHAETILAPGDRIEIVTLVGGG